MRGGGAAGSLLLRAGSDAAGRDGFAGVAARGGAAVAPFLLFSAAARVGRRRARLAAVALVVSVAEAPRARIDEVDRRPARVLRPGHLLGRERPRALGLPGLGLPLLPSE